ncbi:hypothetical protein [Paraflavitalea speifideaquila]|uniref:hypothetical protein n=1 Tax=Paraflavitalea speifideaquila TaxID=3076558 RepID=UPI0028F00D05|nr:hypothetical protein [Paraflavitalea speifideiaquila]
MSRLYRYLEWIAQLQSERSVSTFSTSKLYDYLSEDEVGNENRVINPKGYIQTVNGVLLFSTLGLLALLFMPYYPVLILAGYLLVITAGYFYVSYLRLDDAPDSKAFYAIGYVIGWPVVMLVTVVLYIPFVALFTTWQGSIMGILVVFAVGYMAIVYRIGKLSASLLFKAFNKAPWWKHLITGAIIAIPLLFLYYYNTVVYYRWVFMYMGVVLINAAILNDEKPTFWEFLGNNVYSISGGIAGFLLFQQPGLMVLLLIQIVMAIALLVF